LTSRRPPGLNAEIKEIPAFPPCCGDSSLYIEEIHHRAETVTLILKGIPGYSRDHIKIG
jgi:hypothetical protein